MRTAFLISLATILVLTGLGRAFARPKTDTVVLSNGDHITCEIKQLNQGKLSIKTDDMGTISVKWYRIAALSSVFYFRVATEGGRRYFGSLELREGESTLRIKGVDTVASVSTANVVEITPIEQSFWSRIDGSLSIGYDYSKASGVVQFSSAWNNTFRTEKRSIRLNLQTTVTDKGDSTETLLRQDYNAIYDHIIKKKLAGSGSFGFQRNDELSLQSRILASIGLTVNLRKTNHDFLHLTAGVALNSETAKDSTQASQSGEGVLSVSYSIFVYDTPKIQINADLNVYPSLTEDGRFRFKADLTASYELLKDFFLELSYYSDYDNQSASGEGAKRDYSYSLGVGWNY